MKVGILFSGGKDSVMALYWAKQNHSPVVLISLKSEREDSYMFHVPNIDFVKQQAEAIGIPLIFEKTAGIKEDELKDLKSAVKKAKEDYGIEGLVAGALASNYQKSRVEKICEELDLESFAPYWHFDPGKYMNEIINSGFEVIITGVAAEGLDKNWLGKKIDDSCLSDLKKLNEKYGLHIAFEGGEAETFVLNCPMFKKRIKIEEAEKVWERTSGQLIIKRASLVPKGF